MNLYLDSYVAELGEYLIAKTIERAQAHLEVNPDDAVVAECLAEAIVLRDFVWTRARGIR